MMRQLAFAVLLSSCADIPDPSTSGPHGAEAGAEAGADSTTSDGGYAGPCDVLEGIQQLGYPGFHVAGNAPGTAVNFFLTPALDIPSGEYFRLGAYAAGTPDELRGRIQSLGAGTNASLATCVHCLVIERECETTGINCKRGPYFARSGRAVATQINAEVDAPFLLELVDVELVRVAIDETTLRTTPLSGDEDCVRLPRFLAGATTYTPTLPCHLGRHCDLAANASDRHPD